MRTTKANQYHKVCLEGFPGQQMEHLFQLRVVKLEIIM